MDERMFKSNSQEGLLKEIGPFKLIVTDSLNNPSHESRSVEFAPKIIDNTVVYSNRQEYNCSQY